MKTIVAVALALLVPAGCAKAAPEIKPYDQIDVDAWRASLVNFGASRNADMESLYDLATKECDSTVDQLALKFTLSNAQPEMTRIGMQNVCPSRVGNVDQALLSNQDTEDLFARICKTPRSQRSHDDQRLLDVVGPGACG
jgi:hypothetical protein